MTRKNTMKEMLQLTMLIALVVVLQMLSAIIPPIGGMVSITLTLVPVVVGAILFGLKGGMILGATFGIIVFINCLTGMDPGGNILWLTKPFITASLCLVKGLAAGAGAALVYRVARGKAEQVSHAHQYVAGLLAAMVAPICNTGLFIVGMLLFFRDTLMVWAGGTDLVSYVLLGLAGINFLVEFVINIALSPAIVRVVEQVRKGK